MNDKLQNTLFYIFLISVYITIFILIFGYLNFNIFYTDWCMVTHHHTDSADIILNYLNFFAFLNDDSIVPAVRNNAYPFITSVLSIDYAPVIMVSVKIFCKYILKASSIINIQYAWWYGLFCFILNGLLAFKILKKTTGKNNFVILLCTIFFILAPPLIARFPYHFVLTSHFLILLSFIPFVYQFDRKKEIIFYFLSGFLACGIASTFVPIVSGNLTALTVLKIIRNKKILNNIIPLSANYAGILLSFTLWGGFIGSTCLYGVGYRYTSANLNTFINPANVFGLFKSDLFPFLNNLHLYFIDQNEGFAYLGGGFLILTVFAVIYLCYKYKPVQTVNYLIKYKTECFFLCFLFLFILLCAASLNITFSNRLLLAVKVPVIIEKALSIFRASGRFIWVDFYLIYFAVFIFILKNFDAKKAGAVIFCALALQIYDLKSAFINLHNEYKIKYEYKNFLNDNYKWSVLNKNKNTIITSRIEDSGQFNNFFKNMHNAKFPSVYPVISQKYTSEVYKNEIKSQIEFKDFYYWAIYNRYKINSLIRSRQPKNNRKKLDYIYFHPSVNDLFLFTNNEMHLIEYGTRLKNCYSLNEDYIVCTKDDKNNQDKIYINRNEY